MIISIKNACLRYKRKGPGAAVVPKSMDGKIIFPVLACYGNNPSVADHVSMPFVVGVDG